MDEPNNDIDTETLQAQIDLSMAYAQNLVASWLPSSSLTHSPSSSRAAEAEAELQTLLRRPPRLGVGAPLPETSAPAQMRLIQKLQGGKKHARNMENGIQDSTAASAMVNDSNQREGEEEEDGAEEDTRAASAVRKRPRVVDPFESGGKNKKKMKKVVAEAAETAVEAVPTKGDVVEEAPPLGSVVATVDTMTNPSPKKRKRKRKNKQKTVPLPEDQGAQGRTEGPVVDVLPVEGGAQSLLEEWDGIGDFKEISWSGTPTRPSSSHSAVVPPDVGAPSTMVSPKPQRGSPSVSPVRQASTTSLSPTHPAFSPPLLNLTGAPPLPPEEMESSPPKKRRRKRKKKKQRRDQVATSGNPP